MILTANWISACGFPSQDRTLEELQNLRVPTSAGLVPISNFVTFEPAPRTGTVRRIDQKRVVTIEANVAPGLLVNDQVTALTAAMEAGEIPSGVTWSFAGEAEDQAESMKFLVGAFITAIFLMFVILLTQFNNFYQAFIVMSAIIFSIAGVLLGLLVTGRPFGVVMGGIGVIALAGIVVNNNIVLIDTFNDLMKSGCSPMEAALRTGAQRLRPVILTSITTALGLMPMVIGLNINFFSREIVYGAPSTQWWTEIVQRDRGRFGDRNCIDPDCHPRDVDVGPQTQHPRRSRGWSGGCRLTTVPRAKTDRGGGDEVRHNDHLQSTEIPRIPY